MSGTCSTAVPINFLLSCRRSLRVALNCLTTVYKKEEMLLLIVGLVIYLEMQWLFGPYLPTTSELYSVCNEAVLFCA